MTINVDPIQCIKSNFLNKATNQIKLFTTLVSQSEGFDPHKCPVIISASEYDFNNFHLIDTCSHISTLPKDNSWFRVEFTRGIVLIVGFRLINFVPQPSPPARFVQIVQTSSNRNNEMFLIFYHLDFFGSYI